MTAETRRGNGGDGLYYPLFERSEGFYHWLALTPDWDDKLARTMDMETLARAELDEGERIVLHLRQLGYTVREIAGYYGTSQAGLNRKLKKIFDRMADAIIAEHYRRYEAERMLGDAEMEV